MRRRLAYVLATVISVGLSLAFLHGCAQQTGDKCQIDSDCVSNDICNKGTGLCQPAGSMIDSAVIAPDSPVDAGPPDATPADAAFDASVDAMPDA